DAPGRIGGAAPRGAGAPPALPGGGSALRSRRDGLCGRGRRAGVSDRHRAFPAAPGAGAVIRKTEAGPEQPAGSADAEAGKVSDMTCEEFWNRAPDGREHLAECAACALRFERQEEISAGLRRLGAPMRGRSAPAYVERNLVAGFRAHTRLQPRPRPRDLWWAALAWAAAVAVTGGLPPLLAAGHPRKRPERQPRQTPKAAAVEAAPALSPGEAERGGGFTPLPNAERIGPNEPMNMVRLELPRSTMIGLGFEVSAEQAEEAVEADVMLGADGIARAVRVLE